MTLLKALIAGGQACLRRSYATGSKYIETTRDNDTGKNAISIECYFILYMPLSNFISFDDHTGIEIISMGRKPVNSLNTELLNELKTSLLEAQNNKAKGIILTSSLPTVFSAGLDIMEMYTTDTKKLAAFWTTLQDTWLTLYSLTVPIATAINVQNFSKCYYYNILHIIIFTGTFLSIQGSSPAGGCMLAISTEYRVMVEGKHTIGLNETQLGIVAPKWFRDMFISVVGYRQAELALLRYITYLINVIFT